MNLTLLFGLLGGLLVLAFVANRLARYTGVPDVLVLMLTGVIFGPVLHLVDASRFTEATHAFGTLALILILFEAGLDLRVHEMVRHLAGGFLLAFLSYGLTAAAIAAISVRLLHLPLLSALVVGAVLGGVSSSVTLPVLQQFELRAVLKTPLVIEGSLSDIFAVVAVSTLVGLPQGAVVWSELLHGVLFHVFVALAIGAGMGFAWTRLLPKLSDQRFWQVLTLAVVLLIYAGTEAVHAGGLFAIVIFGLVISNLPARGSRVFEEALAPGVFPQEHSAQILAFHSELSFLVRTFFFVLIGVIIQFAGLRRYALLAAAVVVVIYVSRWVGVHLSRIFWRGSHPREREFALWLVPRGLITAVLAFQVLAVRGPGFRFLVTLAFATILVTNLLLAAGTFRARRLGEILAASELPEAPPGEAPPGQEPPAADSGSTRESGDAG
jgi:Na+:H+ antiporter